MDKVDKLAKVLWDYHHLDHEIEKADILMCFTSLDLSVAKYCAELFHKKYAPLVMISGGNATNKWIPDSENIQRTNWGTDSEAEKYHEVVLEMGVPKEAILLETNSTNSGENVIFSYEILKQKNLIPKSVIVVHKPTMERRAYAAFKNYWPEKGTKLMVTSMPISYEDYVGKIIEKDVIINTMVGDLQRIKLYPDMGFQIIQDIPTEVWSAYEELVKLGYDKHLIHKK
jgi:uncharacterized SAM-binding protein YcdF (DUF218 family)